MEKTNSKTEQVIFLSENLFLYSPYDMIQFKYEKVPLTYYRRSLYLEGVYVECELISFNQRNICVNHLCSPIGTKSRHMLCLCRTTGYINQKHLLPDSSGEKD